MRRSNARQVGAAVRGVVGVLRVVGVLGIVGFALGSLGGCGGAAETAGGGDSGAPDRRDVIDAIVDAIQDGAAPGDAAAPADAGTGADRAADAGSSADAGGAGDAAAECGPSGATAMRTLQLTANSAAELTGAVIGAGASALERKQVTVRVERSLPHVALGDAYLIRTSRATEETYLVMQARNTGTVTSCFLQAMSFSWRSADEAVLSGDGPDFLYVTGAMGGGAAPTNTCLGPGDIGYFLDLRSPLPNRPLFTAVTTIVLSLSDSVTLGLAGGSLLATSYSASSCAAARELSVELENAGATPLIPDLTFAKALFLDGDGLPLAWTFFNPPGPGVPLAPGARLSVPVDLPFQPLARRLRVYARFVAGP